MRQRHTWWLACCAAATIAATSWTSAPAHADETVPVTPSPSTSSSPSGSPTPSVADPPTSAPPQSIVGGQENSQPAPSSEVPDEQAHKAPIVSPISSDPLVVTPGALGSTVQTVRVDVGDANTVSALASVVLCMYELKSGDPTCNEPNTSYTMKLTWTQDSGVFRLLPETATTWSEAESTSTYDAGNTSMAISFRFRVGAVAHAGQWVVAVQAIDREGGISNLVSQSATVNYSASITGRAPQNFSGRGSIGGGGTAYALNASDGTIVANAPSTVTIKIDGPFVSTDGSFRAGLMGGDPETPVRPGFVALDCSAGPSFVVASAVRLTTREQELQVNVGPTGEAGVSDSVNSCRLISGGRLPAGTYEAGVTTGIRQN